MKQHQVQSRKVKLSQEDPEELRGRRIQEAQREGEYYREEGRLLAMGPLSEQARKLLMPLESDD